MGFHVVHISLSTRLFSHHFLIHFEIRRDYGCLTCVSMIFFPIKGQFSSGNRFLYADPTPSALQVYLHGKPTTSSGDDSSLSSKGGTWINADPIPGCVVCNIGESGIHILFTQFSANSHIQCGRRGQVVSTEALFIE